MCTMRVMWRSILGIPYYVVNFEERFEQQVVKPFIDDYLAGRTPIPCTLCNNFIKFDQFLEMAEGVGADRIATGHYAQIRLEPGQRALGDAAQRGSRQGPDVFSVWVDAGSTGADDVSAGRIRKAAVRELARELGIPTAEKPDSQEICFVPNGDYAAFIDAYLKEQGVAPEDLSGELVTADGRWWASIRACTSSPWGSGAGSASRRVSRCM